MDNKNNVKIDYVLTTKGVLNIAFNGKAHTVAKHEERFKRVAELCEQATVVGLTDPEVDELTRLLNPSAAIKDSFSGALTGFKLEVIHGVVYKDGEPIHNAVTRKIQEFVAEDLPFGPLFRFLERLEANPSAESRAELYDFLDRTGLPITPDGCFLAYKGVTEDFKDCHTRTFDNSPGQVHELARDQVDPDRRRQCSYGFHVGAYPYASSFGRVVVRVKVDPSDAVAVPLDHDAQKLRTRKYEVLDVYDTSKGEMPKPLYGEKGEDFIKPEPVKAEEPVSEPTNTSAWTQEKVRDILASVIEEVTECTKITDFDREIDTFMSEDSDDFDDECTAIENKLNERLSTSDSPFELSTWNSINDLAMIIANELNEDREDDTYYAIAEDGDDEESEEDQEESEPQAQLTDHGDGTFTATASKGDLRDLLPPMLPPVAETEKEPEEGPMLDKGPFTSVKKRTSWYMDEYTRDGIVAYAAKRGVVKHKEEARRIGKEATAQRLAEQDFAAKD